MIELSLAQLDHIRTIAERAYPEECCGLLVGRDLTDGVVAVTRIVDSPNVRRDRARDRFEIDPKIRLAVEREIRDGSERVVGHYHSHPDHPARPSATDLDMAFEPSLIWVIVSVAVGHADSIAAFKVRAGGDAFDEVAIAQGAAG